MGGGNNDSSRFSRLELCGAIGATFAVTVLGMNLIFSEIKLPEATLDSGPSRIGESAINTLERNRFHHESEKRSAEELGLPLHRGETSATITDDTVRDAKPMNDTVDITQIEVKPLPFVSIMTLSSGQHFLDRNTMLNALYQSYPHERLELLVLETNNRGPSDYFLDWNMSLANETYRQSKNFPFFRYWYYTDSEGLQTGGKRNFLLDQAKGDIIVHLDNDDIGLSNYIANIVEIFMSAATNSSKILPGGHNVTTRCCKDNPNGPLLRDMANQAAYSKGYFNPDGSTEFTAFPGGNNIGALTSYTAGVAKKCRFKNFQVMEEQKFFHCIDRQFGTQKCTREDMPGQSDQQLLRFMHPLSITSMGWYVDRVRWNQLTGVDMDRLYQSITYWYEWLHELTRPVEVERIIPKVSRFNKNDKGAAFWADFHKSHPKLLSGGSYPYCDGYVATPGQMWPKPPELPNETVHAKDAMDCCNKCKSINDGRSCNAFTFNKTADAGCAMMISRADEVPDLHFKGYLGEAAYFYEFESAVLLKACEKCGGKASFK